MKEVLLNMLLPVFKEVGKVYIKAALQKIQDNNSKEIYENTLKSIHSSFLLLDEVAKKSKTKVDDDLIEAILEAVQESAQEDNVTL